MVTPAVGLRRLEPLLSEDWSPEALAAGTRAAYLWCPDGVIKGRVAAVIDRTFGDGVTMRNWATMQKLQTLLERVLSGREPAGPSRHCRLKAVGVAARRARQ